MKLNKIILICLICLASSMVYSQKYSLWLTYGQAKFLYLPGAEFNFFINKHIGFQVGFSTNIKSYDENKIVNDSETYPFNLHNGNLGICGNVLKRGYHKLGATIGFKAYYGPDFEVLHYYKKGGYNIYFDSSELRPDFGVDLGFFYSYKRITGLFKFDTARKKIRVGIGYSFGKFKEDKLEKEESDLTQR